MLGGGSFPLSGAKVSAHPLSGPFFRVPKPGANPTTQLKILTEIRGSSHISGQS
ncbi:hypothetical protein LEP1GSC060_1461 [Leptospira weilii serovar Ranarum str. ICFT]|uniref:Uncharacterized protein n=1 Tax=Leptospira weilii serovar Ranarum str. ICFT TaxID=1218598 RepID=N1WG77_9LEPT|nr:hypothetical protein LEP1GSC060_1461 [Leptospira weilii serovar Ranarum str. ICFT]